MAGGSTNARLRCLSYHLTLFTGYFYVAPNKIDFDEVFKAMVNLPPENLFVLCTVCLVFAFYAVGLVFARKADNRDKMKVRFSNKDCKSSNLMHSVFQNSHVIPYMFSPLIRVKTCTRICCNCYVLVKYVVFVFCISRLLE